MDLLPIDSIRSAFDEAVARRPVVVTAPTGSGKSTQVPRWCRARGRVLIVEPRRVACRSLALRVAELEGCTLGSAVGYSVRDEHRSSSDTEVLFATTGIVIRMLAESGRLDAFATVILDEFHERSLDVDLLLALLSSRRAADQALVVMSATLDGERVTSHLGGELIEAEGRLFPVERRYHRGHEDVLLPTRRGVEARVREAFDAARDAPGDVLVFLPGKAEIAGTAEAFGGLGDDLALLPLHGGLSLDEQTRAFRPDPAGRRKVILSTNVAETSVTVPGVGVVIDSGLVRRTAYHNGRAYLTLMPIAHDSAEQRAGRAGRTAPGLCVRLWSEAALLDRSTPPEVHREALAPLVLAAAACGARPESLPFLDPPKDYALLAAREELDALGAIDAGGALTDLGRQIFGLPVDAALGRLLVEARSRGCIHDAADLVAVLSVGRPLFTSPLDAEADVDDDPRATGCDATAMIRALRARRQRRWARVVNRFVLKEARQVSARLRGAFGLPAREPDEDEPVDRQRLAATVLAADPRAAHVARVRRGRVAWSNGGTELELARESGVDALKTPAIAVLASRALGSDSSSRRRRSQVLATCAMPLELSWLVEAGLGHERLTGAALEAGAVVATVERVYARRVLAVRERVPTGSLAREALRDLFLRGELESLADSLAPALERLEAIGLLRRLREAGRDDELLRWHEDELDELDEAVRTIVPEHWVLERLEALGVESGDDLKLLVAADLLPPALPDRVAEWLDRHFPRHLALGDARYDIVYDLAASEVTLVKVAGQRKEPPPLAYLPAFPGFRVVMRDRSRVFVLRG